MNRSLPPFSKSRLFALWKKEILQILRDPLLILIFFSAVTIQLVLFSYSIQSQIRGIPFIVLDNDQTFLSRDLISSLQRNGFFSLQSEVQNEKEMGEALRLGRAPVGLIFPKEFSKKIKQDETVPLQVYLDGAYTHTTLFAKVYLLRIVNNFFQEQRPSADTTKDSAIPHVKAHYQILHNPELKDTFFMIPGVMGAILILIVTALAAASFVREKESGTLASVQMSPIHPLEFLLGKTLPLLIISLFFTFLGFTLSFLWFKVPFSGSLILLLLGTVCFLLFCIGVGFISACFSRSQFQAILSCLMVLGPSLFLSGTMGQSDLWWPPFLRMLSRFNPLYYYVSLSRGVLITDLGWKTGWKWLWPLLLTLGGTAFLSILLSSRFFKGSHSRE